MLFSHLSVCMSSKMDGLVVLKNPKPKRVLKKPKPKKITRKKMDSISRSNILKKIIYSLENKLYAHMLYWADRKKKEFIIKFVHKNNPKWNSTYLELFKELDKLSYKYGKYLQENDYEERCKGRCKANLNKLCGEDNNGALTFIEEFKEENSIRVMKYKLNVDDISDITNPVSKGRKMNNKNYVNGLSGCGAVKGVKAYSEDKCKIEILPNEQSHYLCLSNFNQIVYVLVPVGASTSSACASPTNCAESQNSDFQSDGKLTFSNCNNHVDTMGTRNVATTQYTPSGYNESRYGNNPPNEFQAGASPTNCAESQNSDFQSDGKLTSPNCNNHVEVMGTRNVATMQYTPSGYNGLQYSNNPPNEFQDGASPTNCAENLNSDFQSDGKLTFPNCNNHVEAMGTLNVATTQYTPSGYNGLKYSNNSPNGYQAGASPTNCAENLNSDFQSDRKLTFPNCNNHIEAMGTRNVATMQYTPSGYNGLQYSNNPPNEFQAGASPTNCAEYINSDFQSDGKLTFPNCNNHVEVMGTRNVATMQYTPSGYNGLKYSNNPPNGYQACASPTNCAENQNSDFQSDGKLTSPNCNNHVEVMGTRNVATMQYTPSGYNGLQYSNNPPNEFQAGASPTNCAENLNSDFQSDGKLTFPNCNNHVEVMGTRNVATMQYTPSGYNGLKYSNNPPNGYQAGASPTNCAENLNSDFQSDGKLTFPNCNNHVEAMGTRNVATTQYTPSGYNGLKYSNNPPNGFQAGASPTNCAENLNSDFQSDGKLTFPNCNNHVEAMGTRNVATTQYTPSGYNGLKYSNNPPNEFQAGASPTNCAESLNSDFQSDGKLTFPNCNNHVEVMGTRNVATTQYTPSGYNGLKYSNNPLNGFQAGASPTNCAENLNSDFQSDGKLTFPNCNNHVEAMGTRNAATTQYTPSGYNGSQYSNNPPNEFWNEGLQDLNVKSKNCAQMVPGSPLEYNVNSNDPSFEWDMDDISKPLQGDYDPLLSSTISDPSSNNLFEGNGCLLSDTEDWFSFENIVSIDAV